MSDGFSSNSNSRRFFRMYSKAPGSTDDNLITRFIESVKLNNKWQPSDALGPDGKIGYSTVKGYLMEVKETTYQDEKKKVPDYGYKMIFRFSNGEEVEVSTMFTNQAYTILNSLISDKFNPLYKTEISVWTKNGDKKQYAMAAVKQAPPDNDVYERVDWRIEAKDLPKPVEFTKPGGGVDYDDTNVVKYWREALAWFITRLSQHVAANQSAFPRRTNAQVEDHSQINKVGAPSPDADSKAAHTAGPAYNPAPQQQGPAFQPLPTPAAQGFNPAHQQQQQSFNPAQQQPQQQAFTPAPQQQGPAFQPLPNPPAQSFNPAQQQQPQAPVFTPAPQQQVPAFTPAEGDTPFWDEGNHLWRSTKTFNPWPVQYAPPAGIPTPAANPAPVAPHAGGGFSSPGESSMFPEETDLPF